MVNVVDELGCPTNIAYLATKMENPYLKSPGGHNSGLTLSNNTLRQLGQKSREEKPEPLNHDFDPSAGFINPSFFTSYRWGQVVLPPTYQNLKYPLVNYLTWLLKMAQL
jgi:hypothetical protein